MTIGKISVVFLSLSWLLVGCTTMDNGAKKPAPSGLISTPVSYYSTTKAKYLATKYKENLDRIIEQIVRNPKTAPLQFANNIASVGGIGFFTHSATKTPDERYLEVVLATPETFETKGDYSEKVQRLFSSYGFDLLRILSGDGELYQEGELTGYGLNLAWRNVVTDPAGNRVMMARAIVYLPKDRVRNYLRSEIKQNELLADAVIFGEEEDRPLTLVSYRPQDPRPDVRPAIREDNLTATAEWKPSQAAPPTNAQLSPGSNQQMESVKADGSGLEAVPNTKTELIAQEPAVAVAPEPLKNDRSTSSELASLVDGDKSPNSASSVSSAPQERPQGSRPATEVKTDTQTSTARIPDKKIDTKQPTANSRVQAPAVSMEKQAVATAAKASVSPEAIGSASSEEPQEIRREPVEPYVIAKTSEVSALEKAKIPLAGIPPAQIEAPVETSKIISEPKETPVEPANVISAKNNSVPRTTETEPASLPQPIINNQSRRETKEVTKPAPEVVPPSKNEEVRAESAVSKIAEKITTIPEAAKAQIESPKPKPEPNIAPAAAVQKALDVTNHEFVSNAATKPSSEKFSTDSANKTAVPVVGPTSMMEKPVLSEKGSAPAPSTRWELESARSKEQPRQAQVALSPRPEPEQNTVPRAMVQEQKQDDRALDIESRTAKPSGILPSSQSHAPTPAVPAPEPIRNKPVEQIALLRKPADATVETKPITRTVKPLEGFVIQIAFNDKYKAQHWAESMERRGYAVSVTETGAEGALRVRLGNFSVRDDAERQLRSFKQEGMNGIIINLPQGFQPARSSVP